MHDRILFRGQQLHSGKTRLVCARWLCGFFCIAIALYVSIAAVSAYVWTIWAGITVIEQGPALLLDQIFAVLELCAWRLRQGADRHPDQHPKGLPLLPFCRAAMR